MSLQSPVRTPPVSRSGYVVLGSLAGAVFSIRRAHVLRVEIGVLSLFGHGP